jgi:hypothetical protein
MEKEEMLQLWLARSNSAGTVKWQHFQGKL